MLMYGLFRKEVIEMEKRSVSEQLLQMLINKSVSEKLSVLTREFADFTKEMNEADRKVAAIMVLGMVETASGEFFIKMKSRIMIGKESVKSE
jgi:hypothetical protein